MWSRPRLLIHLVTNDKSNQVCIPVIDNYLLMITQTITLQKAIIKVCLDF